MQRDHKPSSYMWPFSKLYDDLHHRFGPERAGVYKQKMEYNIRTAVLHWFFAIKEAISDFPGVRKGFKPPNHGFKGSYMFLGFDIVIGANLKSHIVDSNTLPAYRAYQEGTPEYTRDQNERSALEMANIVSEVALRREQGVNLDTLPNTSLWELMYHETQGRIGKNIIDGECGNQELIDV
eukprot:m.247257 g.247257  ORF g.247257 m.247257 type:complete len:180 (+) comp16126_c0_seq9:681-1220(+)